MAAAWNDVPATGGLSECAALVRSAEALRTSAPELSVQLARRALLVGATDMSAATAHAGEARTLSMRAQAVLASGLVRTSQHVGAVEPGFAALALAESGGALVLAAELRLDLAACAQEVGEPLLGGALLRPVLEAAQAPPSVRAAALGRLVGCVAHVARRDDVEDALTEADRLLAADDGLNPDARRMERARLAIRTAAYHRWYGDNEEAVTAARDGLILLSRLRRELRAESGRLHARLVLELVCALLDEGELHEAETAARSTVDEPVRATSAESVGLLMLAVATRVHLPAGEMDRGRSLVDQAAWLAERHGLDSVLADALTEASRLDEQIGRTKEALASMRTARAAEQRRMRAVARAARHLLVQVGAGQGAKDVTQQSIAALLRQLAHPAGVPVAMAPPPPPAQRSTLPPPRTSTEPHAQPTPGEVTDSVDERTGLLNREGLFRRLRSVRTGESPVSLTLVRFEPNKDNPEEDRGPDTGIMVGLADKVRDIAPEDAELARSDGGELAVFLPHTTRDQAEEFAATIRETATKSDWLADGSGKDLSISTSVVQSDPTTADTDTQLDATGMLTAARDALTTARPTPPPPQTTTGEAMSAGDDSLAETKAALSALSEQSASQPGQPATPPHRPQPSPAQPERPADRTPPRAALEDEPPTTPLHVAKPGDTTTAGRSILNSLSIPTGSGGRRRAGGEPAPGERPTRPTESTQAPRLPQTDHGNQEPPGAPPAATGWPAEPDVSQPLHRTTAKTTHPTGDAYPTDAPRNNAPHQPHNATQPSDTGLHPTGDGTDLTGSGLHSSGGGIHSTGDGLHSSGDGIHSTGDGLHSSGDGTHSTGSGLHSSGDGTHSTGSGLHSSGSGAYPTGGSSHVASDSMASTSGAAPVGEAPAAAAELSPPSMAAHPLEPADHASSYEETRAELARMMSALNAKALRSRKADDKPTTHEATENPTAHERANDLTAREIAAPGSSAHGSSAPGSSAHEATFPEATDNPADNPSTHEHSAVPGGSIEHRQSARDLIDRFVDMHEILVPRQSIPTSPEPDEMPEPPSRPDIPEPPAPDPIPPFTPEPEPKPAEPGAPRREESRSRLMAAFDALTGPVPLDEERDDPGEPLAFSTDFDGGAGLPSRKPLKSWSELESASVVDSPADNLFGAPAEKPAKSSLGAAFGAGEPPGTGTPAASERPVTPPPAEPEDNVDQPRWRNSTSAELRAALWGRGTDEPAPTPYELPSVVPGEWIIGPVNESSATFGEWSTAAESVGSEPSGAGRAPSGASAGLHSPPAADLGAAAIPGSPTDAPAPDADAPPTTDTTPLTRPSTPPTTTTYDEPIGPQPRPEGLPRRGERSATTIASLLTEALAAYQSTADDEGEPQRFDSFLGDPMTNPGRHRSPE